MDATNTISLLEFMTDTQYTAENGYLRCKARCADGFTISIQASAAHYCKPSQAENQPYESLELGYPSKREPMIMQYAEDNRRPTRTVYGYVPWEVVEKMLEKHGGIVGLDRKNQVEYGWR